jgi:hypothetical protein
MLSLVSEKTRQTVPALRMAFFGAQPFRHVVIDEFFAPELAEGLLRDFPAFSAERAQNEFGEMGNKATVEEVRQLGEHYIRADLLVSSAPFLQLISEITGIDDLIYDPSYFGGGTHENCNGQELDPHVDFNYDRRSGYHRRLNLIVYLNKEWEKSWGGSIEVHSNPRDWASNNMREFLPLFNRGILFETNEHSWHGFSLICLPAGKRHLSRKSFTIYYYTKERPAHEVAPPHTTFYVQRPLPADIGPGSVLTEENFRELRGLVHRRDCFINLYQKQELEYSRRLRNLESEVGRLKRSRRLPALGWARQDGGVDGFYDDGWVGKCAKARYRAARPLSRVELRGWVPTHFGDGNIIALHAGGETVRVKTQPGQFTLTAHLSLPKGAVLELIVEAERTSSGKQQGENDDEREVAFILRELAFE